MWGFLNHEVNLWLGFILLSKFIALDFRFQKVLQTHPGNKFLSIKYFLTIVGVGVEEACLSWKSFMKKALGYNRASNNLLDRVPFSCKSFNRYFCIYNFLYPEFWVFIINYPGNGFNTVKKVFCFITQFLFLWNTNKTVFIVVRKIVGMILHKWRISGLSQSVSCPFADKQAFSVQFRSMDRGRRCV